MPYVLPQVQVFQDFRVVPTAVANPLRAHISGPHAYLLRYADADERPLGRLGYYDRLVARSYDWPDRPAGAQVDEAYTKLWVKDALLKYFEDTASSGGSVTKVSGSNNRVRAADTVFASGNGSTRSADLLDRDVKPGDVAKVRGLDGDGSPVTLWTYVKRLIGEVVSSEYDAAFGDAGNQAGQAASSSATFVSGPENCVTVTPDHAAYDGRPDGFVNDTYDVLVTESSSGGDATTARLRVISGSGLDDRVDVVPSAFGEPTDIGTRGLVATIDLDPSAGCSDSAEDAEVNPTDLVAGQRWRIPVAQAFTAPAMTVAGTYDGPADATVIVDVIRGGAYSAELKPLIVVTTTTGGDISGPTQVTAAATPVDIGSYGLTAAFSETGLRKGDKYYVVVRAESAGALKTIELGNNISSDVAADSELDLTLFIRKPLLEVPAPREGFAPVTNWSTSSSEVTVSDGVVAYDDDWTDGGVPQPLDLYSEASKDYGIVYVEYRAWRSDLANDVFGIQDVGEINDLIPGALHPDNPLKWGVFKALENSNGAEVKFTAVADPADAESWAEVLELLLGREDVYGLVPLTRDRTVLDLYAAHVTAQSSAEQALWRVLWVSLEGLSSVPIVSAGSDVPGYTAATTTDGAPALAVFEDDPDNSGSQYTVLRVADGNADFLASGVRPGDVVRALYTGDGFGNQVYSEFVVDEVRSEDELLLLTGPSAPISVAAKVEVWRNLKADEEAAAIAANASSWASRRVRAVWPDLVESSGTVMEGYHLCAALAAQASGVLPHQGLTRLALTGFTAVPRSSKKFNRRQLDLMGGLGVWIVTQDVNSGVTYTRQAVTTASYDDVNVREEMITRNFDSISFRFKRQFDPFIGVTNVTPVIEARIRLEIGKLIRTLQVEGQTGDLGGQLIDADIAYFGPHAIFRDRYVLMLGCTGPTPLNNMDVHLIVT